MAFLVPGVTALMPSACMYSSYSEVHWWGTVEELCCLLVCSLSNVVRIERVQNPHLWTKYCLRRHEVELAAGSAHINEQSLFHGCRKDIMAVIANEGFDIRVAGMQGSLGAGTYFAGTQ